MGEAASRVIGREGKKAFQLQQDFDVRILSENSNGNCTLTIRGKNQNVQRVCREIREIITEVENREPVICKYYMQNKCMFGPDCRFHHPPKTGKRDSSPNKKRETPPKRQKQDDHSPRGRHAHRSREYSTDNIRDDRRENRDRGDRTTTRPLF